MIFNTMEILGHIVVFNYMRNGSDKNTEHADTYSIITGCDVHLYSNKVDIRPPYAMHSECR